MPTDRQAALASTTTKTDNNPHPQAQEGNRSAPPPKKHTKFHSHPGARETFHLLPLPERAGPDGPLSFNHLPPTPKETRSFSLKPLNRRSLAPGTTGIQHPLRSPLRGRGRKPHAGSVSRAPPPPPGPCAPPAGTCPPPPTGEKLPRPHGFRCSHGNKRAPVPPAAGCAPTPGLPAPLPPQA